MRFSCIEYTDMVIAYGLAGENAYAAAQIYAERFPRRTHPSYHTILSVVQKLRETGCLVHRNNVGAPVRRRVENEERILDAFYANLGTSVRRVAREFGLTRYEVHRTLRTNLLSPYHFQHVQQLLPRYLQQRINFCEGIVIIDFLYLW
ncbi:hypothetical protein X777_16216 [Ooceraea biroi]|uniref:DUF4817 domain-containing protein n=1 Tax=Ooceraea biroi TaxID=2015173 RepID=A0A026VXE4_OOCBI|nr:hypothetical protein X777_16216 [Ooceraea biroi]